MKFSWDMGKQAFTILFSPLAINGVHIDTAFSFYEFISARSLSIFKISSRVGGRKTVCSTGVGKAHMLDKSEEEWRAQYAHDAARGACKVSAGEWLALMRSHVDKGYTFDLGEDASLIRCVAAPVRDASLRIVAAISVSSALDYMDEERLVRLVPVVRGVAEQIGRQLGAR